MILNGVGPAYATKNGVASPVSENKKEIQLELVCHQKWVLFASLKKRVNSLFRLICCERKIMFWLKK